MRPTEGGTPARETQCAVSILDTGLGPCVELFRKAGPRFLECGLETLHVRILCRPGILLLAVKSAPPFGKIVENRLMAVPRIRQRSLCLFDQNSAGLRPGRPLPGGLWLGGDRIRGRESFAF